MRAWRAFTSHLLGVEVMSKLLSAGFAKLFKSTVFYVGLAFMVGFPAFVVAVRFVDTLRYPEYYAEPLDGFLNAGLMFIGVVIAVVVSLFLGREYGDLVIRNKLVVGHTRADIYLSNLIVSTTGGIILQTSYLVSAYTLSRIFFGPFNIPNTEIIKMQLLGVCVTAAYSAIFTLIAMLIQSKSAASVTAMITAIMLFLFGMTVYQKLAAEKFTNYSELPENALIDVTEDDDSDEEEEYYEERGLSGTKRKVYEFLDDFLPSAQADQISECVVPEHWGRFVMYDCMIILLTTITGVFIFRRKDLK